jgi:hypothetical protein
LLIAACLGVTTQVSCSAPLWADRKLLQDGYRQVLADKARDLVVMLLALQTDYGQFVRAVADRRYVGRIVLEHPAHPFGRARSHRQVARPAGVPVCG